MSANNYLQRPNKTHQEDNIMRPPIWPCCRCQNRNRALIRPGQCRRCSHEECDSCARLKIFEQNSIQSCDGQQEIDPLILSIYEQVNHGSPPSQRPSRSSSTPMMPYAEVQGGNIADSKFIGFQNQRKRSTSLASHAITRRRAAKDPLRRQASQVNRPILPAVGNSDADPRYAQNIVRNRDSPYGSGTSTAFPSPQESNLDYSDVSVLYTPQTYYSDYTGDGSEPPSATSSSFPPIPGMQGKITAFEAEDHPPPSSPPARVKMQCPLTRAACVHKLRSLKPTKRRVVKEPAKIKVDLTKPGDEARARNTECARNSRKRKEQYIECHEAYFELAEKEIQELQRLLEEREEIILRLEEQQAIMRPSMADHSTPTDPGAPSQPTEPRGANLQLLTNPDPRSARNLGQNDATTDVGATLPPTPCSLPPASRHFDQESNELYGSSINRQDVHCKMEAQLQQVIQHTIPPDDGQGLFEEHIARNSLIPGGVMASPLETDWGYVMPHSAVTAQQASYPVDLRNLLSQEKKAFATSPTFSTRSVDHFEDGPIRSSIEGTGDPYVNSDFTEPSHRPSSTEGLHNIPNPRAERETSIGTLLNEAAPGKEDEPSLFYIDGFGHQWQTHEHYDTGDEPSLFDIPNEHSVRGTSKSPKVTETFLQS